MVSQDTHILHLRPQQIKIWNEQGILIGPELLQAVSECMVRGTKPANTRALGTALHYLNHIGSPSR